MGKMRSYLCGFAIGGLVSGLAVMLNTPKSGREFRNDLKERADELKPEVEEIKVAIGDFKNSIQVVTEKGLPMMKTTLQDVQQLIKTWQEDIQPNIQSIKSGIDEINQQKEALKKVEDEAEI